MQSDSEAEFQKLKSCVEEYFEYLSGLISRNQSNAKLKIRYQALKELKERFEEHTALSETDESLIAEVEKAMKVCKANKPGLEEYNLFILIIDAISSILNKALYGQSNWKTFVDTVVKTKAHIPVLDTNNIERLVQYLQKGNTGSTFENQGYFHKNTVLRTTSGREFRFTCDLLIIQGDKHQEIYPLKLELGQGAYGKVYQAQNKFIRIGDDEITLQENKLTAFKLISINRMLEKPLLKLILATEPAMAVAIYLTKLGQAANLQNEVNKGNQYLQRLYNDTTTDFFRKFDFAAGSQHYVVMQMPLFSGCNLKDFLGYQEVNYAQEITPDAILKKTSKIDGITFEDKLDIVESLIEQIQILEKAGLIHGDLFLDNIQVLDCNNSEKKQVRLMDFTFARKISDVKTNIEGLHRTWQAFNPPEITVDGVKGQDPVSAQMYALAINLQLIFGLSTDALSHPDTIADKRLKKLASLIDRMKEERISTEVVMKDLKEIQEDDLERNKQAGSTFTLE